MRLLVVTNDYPPKPGGIQQYLSGFLAAFPGTVRVLAPADGPADQTALGESVVRRYHRSFMWPTPAVRRWALEEAVEFGPDVILFGAPYPLPFIGPALREATGAPFVVLCHGAEVTLPAALPVARQLLAKALKAADARIAVSRFTADRVERLTGEPVDYVGAGVDLETFALDRDRGGFSDPPVVACVSRFVPRKGQERLIEAAELLARRGEPVQLLIVGKGRTEQRIRKAAAESGVDVRFEVDVPWSRLGELYREADLFCMPCRSRWGGLEVEGLGLVFLEAAATGLPVIAGDSGGSPETVDPGVTGHVVHDVEDIASAISSILADETAARTMGLAGRRWVEQEFTWRRTMERAMSVFERVVASG